MNYLRVLVPFVLMILMITGCNNPVREKQNKTEQAWLA